jgi:hypothetical protein
VLPRGQVGLLDRRVLKTQGTLRWTPSRAGSEGEYAFTMDAVSA